MVSSMLLAIWPWLRFAVPIVVLVTLPRDMRALYLITYFLLAFACLAWSPVPFQYLAPVVLFAVFLLVRPQCTTEWRYDSRVYVYLFLLLAYAVVVVAGLIWTPDPLYGKTKAGQFIIYGIVPALVLLYLWPAQESAEVERIVTISGITGGAMAALGMLAAGVPARGWYVTSVSGSVAAMDKISFSRVAGIGLLCTAWLAAQPTARKIMRIIGIGMTTSFGLLLGVTGGRGPMLSATLAMFSTWSLSRLACVRDRGRRLLVIPAIVALLVVVLLGLTWVFPRVSGRSLLFDPYSDGGRLFRMRAAIQEFCLHPVGGTGTGGLASAIVGQDTREYPHNSLIEVAGENGLLGLMPFLGMLFLTLSSSHSGVNRLGLTGKGGNNLVFMIWLYSVLNTFVSGDLGVNSWILPLGLMVVLSSRSRGIRESGN